MRRVLVLAAMIVVAVVAWWIVESEPPAPPAAATAPASVDAKPAQRSVRRPAAAPAEEAKPAPAQEQPVEKPPVPAELGRRLLVVDAATHEALSGVTVAFLPMGADPAKGPPPELRAAIEKSDPIDVAFEHGRTFTSDAQGRVALPEFDGFALVAARHGGSSGSTTVGKAIPEWRLELRLTTDLTVIVSDAEGNLCHDVPVQLARHTDWGSYAEHEDRTDSTGTAHLRLVREVQGPDSGTLALSVALPFAERPSIAIDAQKPPAETVRLVLPPSGRVRCEVVNDTGAPADGRLPVMLRLADDVAPGTIDIGIPGRFDDARATLADGAALFPYVGLGLDLEVEVASPDASRLTSKQRFAGPRKAGEETVVRVALGGPRPCVVGRLVDPAGAPIAGIEITALIVEPGRSSGSGEGTRSTTGENGRFRFAFDRTPGEATSAKLEIGRFVSSGDGSGSSRRIALVDLPAVLPAGEVEIGDVVFAGTALLVAGVVVDAKGDPLAGATIRAMRLRVRSAFRDVDAVTTDASGSFRLIGDPAGQREVVVGVDLAGWYVPAESRFPVGAMDARILMEEAGGIAGSVLVPQGFTHSVTVLIEGPPADNGDVGHRLEGGLTIHTGEGGRFEVRNLRPGKARVSIRLGWNESDTILTVDDVEVVAGKLTLDPRLQDVDPAKSVHAIRVTVRDAQMHAVESATVHFRPVGGPFWTKAGKTGADGTATVQARAESMSHGGVDLVVTRAGYRSQAVSRATGDVDVVLEGAKASTVRVRLASGCPIPDPPYHLAASLGWLEPGDTDGHRTRDDPRELREHQSEQKFDRNRILTFETYDAGRYRVVLMLWKMDMSGGGGSGMTTVPEVVTVNVPGDGTTVEVEVGFDPQELRRQMDRKH